MKTKTTRLFMAYSFSKTIITIVISIVVFFIGQNVFAANDSTYISV